eukprot:6530679-Prymnesium_polylepis.2
MNRRVADSSPSNRWCIAESRPPNLGRLGTLGTRPRPTRAGRSLWHTQPVVPTPGGSSGQRGCSTIADTRTSAPQAVPLRRITKAGRADGAEQALRSPWHCALWPRLLPFRRSTDDASWARQREVGVDGSRLKTESVPLGDEEVAPRWRRKR